MNPSLSSPIIIGGRFAAAFMMMKQGENSLCPKITREPVVAENNLGRLGPDLA
jgi:hypothetical protein